MELGSSSAKKLLLSARVSTHSILSVPGNVSFPHSGGWKDSAIAKLRITCIGSSLMGRCEINVASFGPRAAEFICHVAEEFIAQVIRPESPGTNSTPEAQTRN